MMYCCIGRRIFQLTGLLTLVCCLLGMQSAQAAAAPQVKAIYGSVIDFDGRKALDDAIKAEPGYLMDKHKKAMQSIDCEENLRIARESGFNTAFMSIYPLYGFEWWKIPSARNLVKDAILRGSKSFQMHIGFSMYNARVTSDPSKYPGGCRTVAWDGQRPEAVCFLDDSLWNHFTQSAVELAKISKEYPGKVKGIFLDPEPYGPSGFLCFCDNCVKKFNRYAKTNCPLGQQKPFDWIVQHGFMNKYIIDWHDYEVRRHAAALRDAVHRVNPKLQLSSFLWEFVWNDVEKRPCETFWRNVAIGLGTEKQPSWAMPEHTYYLSETELQSEIKKILTDIDKAGFSKQVKLLPGLIPVGRPASSLVERGKVIGSSNVVGYWLFQLAALHDGVKDTPDGPLLSPAADYRKALAEMNRALK